MSCGNYLIIILPSPKKEKRPGLKMIQFFLSGKSLLYNLSKSELDITFYLCLNELYNFTSRMEVIPELI